MTNVEHYFENLLYHGHDINNEPNKRALSKEVQDAVEQCVRYIKYSYKGEEHKTCEWIRQTDDYHDYYECANCGIAVGLYDIKNYCPNCGLRMVLDKKRICEERKQNCWECPYEDDCKDCDSW